MTTLYALRFIGTDDLVYVEVVGTGEAEFCGSYEATLERRSFNGVVWCTTSRSQAEKVARETVEWYNTSLEHPQNGYVGELEVVELKVS